MSDNKYIGQVKFFNKDRGFGFITRLDDSKDFFVHHTAIHQVPRCWNILYKGEYVSFGIVEGKQGQQASDVTGVQGGTLLRDHEFEYRRRRAAKRYVEKVQPAEVV